MEQNACELPVPQEIVDQLQQKNLPPQAADMPNNNLHVGDSLPVSFQLAIDHLRIIADAVHPESNNSTKTGLSVSQRSQLDAFDMASNSIWHGISPSSVGSSPLTSRMSSVSLEEIDNGKEELAPSSHERSRLTYEEQFKELYDMGDEYDRKQFLDELFLFMQEQGSPVNRIPILAKQTLDIYKLFKLVVDRGGLVEVINRKMWREIAKGLCLPNSMTSAAFILRTQYMKLLYPFECEMYNFSTPTELHSTIGGNRREGRRPGFSRDTNTDPTLMSTHTAPHFFATSMMHHENCVQHLTSDGLLNYLSNGPPNGLLNDLPNGSRMASRKYK